jgi:hypothetical protein
MRTIITMKKDGVFTLDLSNWLQEWDDIVLWNIELEVLWRSDTKLQFKINNF